jgi:hypothetical protein
MKKQSSNDFSEPLPLIDERSPSKKQMKLGKIMSFQKSEEFEIKRKIKNATPSSL